MPPPTKIRAESQIGGKSLTLGGSASFEGNAPGTLTLNDSVPGAKDASVTIKGGCVIQGTLVVGGLQGTTFVFTQMVASSTWTINHNLGKRPSVSVVTSGGDEVIGDVHYIDDNNLIVTFTFMFAGVAYLN